MAVITGRDNPKIKQIRALAQRKGRQKTGLFLIEGIRHIGEASEAIAAGATRTSIEYICYSPDLLTSEYANRLIEDQVARGVPCYVVSKPLFASLAEKENPQGILAVARQEPPHLDHMNPQNFPFGVALVSPQDPGNIGSILRTIDAVGASGLLLLDTSADPYQPGAVRASMGALFWYPVVSATFDAFVAWARSSGYHIYGTSAHGSIDYREVKEYRLPLILLMGSEREGLTPAQRDACDTLIRLPMEGHATSLNLAIATGIFLYEIKKTL